MPTRNATTTPTPPPLGVAWVCTLRGSGRSSTRAAIIARTTAADSSASPIGEGQVAQQGGKSHAGSSRTEEPDNSDQWSLASLRRPSAFSG